MGKKFRSSLRSWTYTGTLCTALLLGAAPAALVYSVDPYEVFGWSEFDAEKAEFSEKAHYPLWKFTHFPETAETVVLGDSRARSLRDKYWKELGAPNAYNFAYGGGTIPEIYSTFQAIKHSPNLKNLVVGIQLRSFDERHKGGMNRVPEALKVNAGPLAYLKNWFVAKTALSWFKRENPDLTRRVQDLVPPVISKAFAIDLGQPGQTPVSTLLKPEICFGCDYTEELHYTVRFHSKGPNLGLGRGSRHDWLNAQITVLANGLPPKIARQVTKNARTDWNGFQFSETYWAMIEELAVWADAADDRNLVFVIPPTVTQMHATINLYGLAALDKTFRQRLATLAPVLDFDFPNDVTASTSNFSDAYHFKAQVAKQIVGEVLMTVSKNQDTHRLVMKRRKGIDCNFAEHKEFDVTADTQTPVIEGTACKVWSRKNG